MRRDTPLFALALASAAALLWFIPFAWMAVASIREAGAGADDLASLWPSGPFGLANFADAWSSGHFPLWYLNTVLVCGGILIIQCVTVSLAGYAFARMRFSGRNTLFALFLLQLLLVPPILVVPNLSTLVALHLYDTLPGIMAPYCASAFGVFLMRQTFRTIPRDYEEAAVIDGATRLQIIVHVLLPLSRPGLAAFAIVSITTHWNEFLWPLMATSSPSNQVLTVGLATFTAGAEAGSEWGVIAAGTFLVAAPLLVGVRAVSAPFRLLLHLFRHQVTGKPHRCASTLAAALAACLTTAPARAATEIDLFFPVPVQGKLANEMQRLVEVFNKDHADIHVTPVYSGSYDDTNLKTHAAIQAGKPPAAVIMSANFVREYVINDEIDPARPPDREGRHDRSRLHGPVLAGAAAERDRKTAMPTACRSTIPPRCCIIVWMPSRMPGWTRTSRRHLAGLVRRREEAGQARRHGDGALGPDDARHV